MDETPHNETRNYPSSSAAKRFRLMPGSRWLQALLGVCVIAAVAFGGLALARQAQAATYDVCASGCTYTSINAALAAASSGATIKVGPGTYGPGTSDAPITINKSVNLVGAGIGKSIINGAPASGTAIGGLIRVTTPGTAGNISVSGFTIEGAINNDSNDDGILMTINDHNASDVINVKGNLFYGDTTLDPQLLADQTDSIYVNNSSATVNVSGNSFKGVFRAALIEGNPGAFYFTGNTLNLHALYDTSVNPPSMYFWAEGLLFLADDGRDVTTPQVVSGNTFESYLGLGVGLDAGYPGPYVGTVSHLSITGNVFNNIGVATSDSPPFDAADIYMHGFGGTNGTVTSAIKGVTIKDNTFNLSSSTGHGYAISYKGTIGAGNVVDHNVIRGSGSSRPLAGVNFVAPDGAAASVSVTNNIITGFVDGVHSDALPAGAHVSVTQNCITSNTNSGATVAAGTAVAADHNWWGAASGPHATSNPSGTGNGVSANVTFTPFLTSPAKVCAGPVASGISASPAPTPANTGFTLNGTLSDATTGKFAVKSAQYNINGGTYHSMNAKDGSFNEVTEGVSAHVSGLAAGAYTVCVRGKDAVGYTGSPTCVTLTIVDVAATQTASAAATAGAVPTETAVEQPTAPGGTGGSTGGSASSATPTPSSEGFVGIGGLPAVPFIIAIVAALLILAAILFLVISRRRQENENQQRQWRR